MYLVRIPEHGPSISQYGINRMVSVTESVRVYCAVRSLSLCNVQITLVPEHEGSGSIPRQREVCCIPSGTRTGVFRVRRLSRFDNIIPSMLNSHRRLRVSRITTRRSLGPFPKATLFWKSGNIGQKSISTFFFKSVKGRS